MAKGGYAVDMYDMPSVDCLYFVAGVPGYYRKFGFYLSSG